jgi:hypothetical protein
MPALSSTATSIYTTVTVASQQTAALVAGQCYRVISSTDAYIKFGSNPTASAANDSHLISAGREVRVWMNAADKMAIIRVAADGVCTVSIAPP